MVPFEYRFVFTICFYVPLSTALLLNNILYYPALCTAEYRSLSDSFNNFDFTVHFSVQFLVLCLFPEVA